MLIGGRRWLTRSDLCDTFEPHRLHSMCNDSLVSSNLRIYSDLRLEVFCQSIWIQLELQPFARQPLDKYPKAAGMTRWPVLKLQPRGELFSCPKALNGCKLRHAFGQASTTCMAQEMWLSAFKCGQTEANETHWSVLFCSAHPGP